MRYVILLCFSLIFSGQSQAQTIDKIVTGAYGEIHNQTKYNTDMLEKYYPPTFKNGKDTGRSVYPNGDVDPKEGICADLIVRSLRNADIDLQLLVHNDVLRNKKTYEVTTPDKFADHRRVWILKTYFKRNWQSLPVQLTNTADWLPGDVVVWDTGSKKHLHIGIVGKNKRPDGFPHVIHNMRYIPFVFAGKTIEQDVLQGPSIMRFSVGEWKIIGHFRVQ